MALAMVPSDILYLIEKQVVVHCPYLNIQCANSERAHQKLMEFIPGSDFVAVLPAPQGSPETKIDDSYGKNVIV